MSETITEESQIETTITDGVIRAIKSSQKFLQSETDRRLTEGIQTYEKKHGLKDGKPVKTETEKKPDETKGGEEMPEWGKKLLELNEQLVGKITTLETEKKTTVLQEKLRSKLVNDLKIDEHNLKDFNLLNGVQLVEESEIEKVAADIKAKHDATLQSLVERGVNIIPPKEGNAASGLLADIKAWGKEERKDKK